MDKIDQGLGDNIKCSLTDTVMPSNDFLVFPDTLHLLKRVRYRYISGADNSYSFILIVHVILEQEKLISKMPI